VLALTDTRGAIGRRDYPVMLTPFFPEELVRSERCFNALSAGHPEPPFGRWMSLSFTLQARLVVSRSPTTHLPFQNHCDLEDEDEQQNDQNQSD
jgi:hypothetical protein